MAVGIVLAGGGGGNGVERGSVEVSGASVRVRGGGVGGATTREEVALVTALVASAEAKRHARRSSREEPGGGGADSAAECGIISLRVMVAAAAATAPARLAVFVPLPPLPGLRTAAAECFDRGLLLPGLLLLRLPLPSAVMVLAVALFVGEVVRKVVGEAVAVAKPPYACSAASSASIRATCIDCWTSIGCVSYVTRARTSPFARMRSSITVAICSVKSWPSGADASDAPDRTSSGRGEIT